MERRVARRGLLAAAVALALAEVAGFPGPGCAMSGPATPATKRDSASPKATVFPRPIEDNPFSENGPASGTPGRKISWTAKAHEALGRPARQSSDDSAPVATTDTKHSSRPLGASERPRARHAAKHAERTTQAAPECLRSGARRPVL